MYLFYAATIDPQATFCLLEATYCLRAVHLGGLQFGLAEHAKKCNCQASPPVKTLPPGYLSWEGQFFWWGSAGHWTLLLSAFKLLNPMLSVSAWNRKN